MVYYNAMHHLRALGPQSQGKVNELDSHVLFPADDAHTERDRQTHTHTHTHRHTSDRPLSPALSLSLSLSLARARARAHDRARSLKLFILADVAPAVYHCAVPRGYFFF